MKVHNLTPHPISFRVDDLTVSYPPSGTVARVTTHEEAIPAIKGEKAFLPLVRRVFGGVNLGLTTEEGEIYIVSSLVLEALRGEDPKPGFFIAPDTGTTAIRDAEGRITAVTRFVTL